MRKRWIVIGVIAGISLAGAAAAWGLRGQVAYAEIATGYAAKQSCSCVNVSGRPLESCIADFPADAREQISVVQDGDRVHASVLFGAIRADAVYEAGFGCRLLN